MKNIQRTISAAVLSIVLVLVAGCIVDESGRWAAVSPVAVAPPEDYHVDYLRQRAEQSDMVAQFTLASYYENGWGVARDFAEAAKWYGLSASQGYAAAQNRLGDYYYNGCGVPQDYGKAVEWYGKAAAQGYLPAKRSLLSCERRGLVPGTAAPTSQPAPVAPAKSNNPPPGNPLTVDEIKELSSSGVKAEIIISQIKATNSKFSAQDVALAQQASPPIDPVIIAYMKNPTN